MAFPHETDTKQLNHAFKDGSPLTFFCSQLTFSSLWWVYRWVSAQGKNKDAALKRYLQMMPFKSKTVWRILRQKTLFKSFFRRHQCGKCSLYNLKTKDALLLVSTRIQIWFMKCHRPHTKQIKLKEAVANPLLDQIRHHLNKSTLYIITRSLWQQFSPNVTLNRRDNNAHSARFQCNLSTEVC